MKNLKKLFLMLGVLLGLFACSSLPTEEDSSNSVKSSVKFTMQNIGATNSNILFSATDEQTPSKVAISYKKSGEGEAETSTIIKLTAFGDSYITDDVLSLYEGNYELTKFDVLNDTGATIYSTPVAGSEVATNLNIRTALAYNFEVREGEISTEKMQVVAVSDTTDPADFGHTAFTFELVDYNKFYVEVLVLDDSLGWVYTTAKVEVKNAEGSNIKTANIDGKMNKVIVANSDSYKITVSKDGYASQEFSFTKAKLEAYENEAMVVKLKPITGSDNLCAMVTDENTIKVFDIEALPEVVSIQEFDRSQVSGVIPVKKNEYLYYYTMGEFSYGDLSSINTNKQSLPSGWYVLQIIDANNDGHNDLLIRKTTGTEDAVIWTYSIALNNGDNTFNFDLNTILYIQSERSAHILATDVDNDGNIDLLYTSYGNGARCYSNLQIKKGNGDGTFQSPQSALISSFETSNNFLAVDINNDGYKDLVMNSDDDNTCPYNPIIAIYDKDQGKYSLKWSQVSCSGIALVASDINGDGFVDFIFCNYINGSYQYYYHLNNKNGDFETTGNKIEFK